MSSTAFTQKNYDPTSLRRQKRIALSAPQSAPTANPCTDSAVAGSILDSWARCARMGLRPNSCPSKKPKAARHRMSSQDRAITSSCRLFFDAFAKFCTDLPLFLVNSKGIVLRSSGNNHEQTNLSNLSRIDEQTCGTFANTIAQRSGKVESIIGEEHFLDCFSDILSIAAPILDENERPIAHFLTIKKLDANTTLEVSLLQTLLTVCAQGASQSIRFKRVDSVNKTLQSLLIGSLSLIKDACAIIDANGFIIETNKRARQILDLGEKATRRNIHDFLPEEQQLTAIILNGQATNRFSANVRTPQGTKTCLMNIRPVRSPASQGLQGSIATFSEVSPSDNQQEDASRYSFESIIGKNEDLERAKNYARIFAPTNARILLKGATGSGKEHFAKAIHNFRNPKAPFISFNCTTATRGNLEEQLFGKEERGRIVQGRIEQANEGTLFLRNIEDAPFELQGYLVSVIDEMHVIPVGSLEKRAVSFKLITSTKANLKNCVAEGIFRDDLYYRIASSVIDIPPLAERSNDIAELAEHFCKVFCASNSLPPIVLSQDTVSVLESYNWPGNIRQLRTSINYACDICHNLIITPADLPSDILESLDATIGTTNCINQFTPMRDIERQRIEQALRRTNNDVTEAARILGIGRSTLYGRLKEYRAQS